MHAQHLYRAILQDIEEIEEPGGEFSDTSSSSASSVQSVFAIQRPVYLQRYNSVSKVLEDTRWNKRIEKVKLMQLLD